MKFQPRDVGEYEQSWDLMVGQKHNYMYCCCQSAGKNKPHTFDATDHLIIVLRSVGDQLGYRIALKGIKNTSAFISRVIKSWDKFAKLQKQKISTTTGSNSPSCSTQRKCTWSEWRPGMQSHMTDKMLSLAGTCIFVAIRIDCSCFK